MPTSFTKIDGCKVVVTGADGFIGSHLVERLVSAGAEVTALSYYNSFGSAGWLDQLHDPSTRREINVVSGDIRDPYFVSQLCENAEIIFHLAALIAIPFSYVAPQSYVETNITGTLNILEAARRHGARRIVHTSTSEVYGTAIFTPITEAHPLQGQSPYSASKIGADSMAEAYARSFDLPVVTLRPFNTFGPRQSERAVIPSVIRQILEPKCEAIEIGALDPIRDFNYVEDIVDAFLRAALSNKLMYGTPYNAGSGRGVTIADMISAVQAIAGTELPLTVENSRLRPKNSEVFALIASAEKFTTASDWQPMTTLEQGLTKTVDWWLYQLKNGHQRLVSGFQL